MSPRFLRGAARAPLAALTLGLALGLVPARAGAQPVTATDSATAESLFNEALALLESKRPAEACPKLEASQRLDPGVGTLLYLADCYQQLGRTASAWATFREAAYMAKDRKDDREPVAVESAKALEPKLSYLTLEVTPPEGVTLEIKRDGQVIPEAVWNTAIPVDPGPHTVQVNAPGKKPWSTTITVGEGPRQESVVIPALEDAPLPPPTPLSAPPVDQGPEPPYSTQKTVGWVVLGAGSAGLITGGVLALLARGNDSDADAECRPDQRGLCNPAGVKLGESAETKATWAGISAGVGLAAIGAGVTLLLTASPTSESAALSVSARLRGDGAELSLRRTF